MAVSLSSLSSPRATGIAAPGRRHWALLRSVVLPLVLSLICLRSLFHDGYLLQVDIVFGPRPGPVLAGFGAPVTRAAGRSRGGAGRRGDREDLRRRSALPRRLRADDPVPAGALVRAVCCRHPRSAESLGVRPDGGRAVGSRGRGRRSLPLARGLGGAAGASGPESRGPARGVRRGHRRLRSPRGRPLGGADDRRGPVAAALARSRPAAVDGCLPGAVCCYCCRTGSPSSSSAGTRAATRTSASSPAPTSSSSARSRATTTGCSSISSGCTATGESGSGAFLWRPEAPSGGR